jgi:hypothetical protein
VNSFSLAFFTCEFIKSKLVFNHCLSDLLPMNFECSLREYNAKMGRSQRSVDSKDKCERVDPAKRRMLQEKFEMAESYLGRFIANILRRFTDKKDVEGVRRDLLLA